MAEVSIAPFREGPKIGPSPFQTCAHRSREPISVFGSNAEAQAATPRRSRNCGRLARWPDGSPVVPEPDDCDDDHRDEGGQNECPNADADVAGGLKLGLVLRDLAAASCLLVGRVHQPIPAQKSRLSSPPLV